MSLNIMFCNFLVSNKTNMSNFQSLEVVDRLKIYINYLSRIKVNKAIINLIVQSTVIHRFKWGEQELLQKDIL